MQTSVKDTLPRDTAPGSIRAGTSPLWTWTVAGLLAVFYFVTSIQIAAHRVFWFDELFTLHIARLPHSARSGLLWATASTRCRRHIT